MDYEKKYKENLEVATNICADSNVNEEVKSYLKSVFPELAESEDEKIRKAVVKMLKVPRKEIFEVEGITKEQALAWLEKQSEKEKFIKKEIVYIKGYRDEAIRRLHELGKQGKENPLKGTLGDVFDDLKFGLDPSPKQDEQKPEWSEEDEEMIKGLNNCLDELEEMNGWLYTYVNNKDMKLCKIRNWLKFIKDRCLSQPNQEWSEEDEAHRQWILECLADGKRKVPEYSEQYQSAFNWLKSLRPQNLSNVERNGKDWKPSDEQMVALKCAITTANEKWVCMNTKDLESLYEDLKKLKD